MACSPFLDSLNLLVLNDLLLNRTNVMSGVAVCGDATLVGGVSISSRGGTCDKASISLFVQGTLNVRDASGSILGPGSVSYSRVLGRLSNKFYVQCDRSDRSGTMDCLALQTQMFRWNRRACRATDSGSFTLLDGSTGVLHGNGATSEIVYISVAAKDFGQVRQWEMEGLSEGRGVVVNVRGASVTFAESSMGRIQSMRNSLVWNFCRTAEIDHTRGVQVVGGVVAPRARYIGRNNVIDGPVVVGSFAGSTELRNIGPVALC